MEDMEYFVTYGNLGQAAAEVQGRLPAQLDARCDAAGRAGCHRSSESPFRPRPNYAVLLSALLAALPFVACSAVQAAIINARSPSLADVSTAIASAVDGDTVTIPAGTATWSGTLTITKGITLIGQTTTDSVAGTAVDKTIIQDNVPRPSGFVIKCSTTAGKSYRISGLTFAPYATTSNTVNGAIVMLDGSSQNVRVDHCHFPDNPYWGIMIRVTGAVYGVADHNYLEFINSRAFSFMTRNGGGDEFGDGSWADYPWYGTGKFFFYEDNYLKNASGRELTGNTDDALGARWVFRHNKCYNISFQTHGTESGGRYRGGRAHEVYNNEFHWSVSYNVGGFRSGGALTHDNKWYDSQPASGFVLQYYRAVFTFQPFGGANGTSIWDVNDTSGTSISTVDGTNTVGQPPYQYYPLTGSATAATGSNASTIVDSGRPNWATDQWKNFTAMRMSDKATGLILSNTDHILTVAHWAGSPQTWNSGDQYEIHKVLYCLDQSGRGRGDRISGVSPVNTVNGANGPNTPGWPHQALEPCYSWNDYYVPSSGSNVELKMHAGKPNIHENRDYYNLGLGASDSAVRTRYVAALNGVDYLGPYTYPHPLVSGASPTSTPSAPQNLRVVP